MIDLDKEDMDAVERAFAAAERAGAEPEAWTAPEELRAAQGGAE